MEHTAEMRPARSANGRRRWPPTMQALRPPARAAIGSWPCCTSSTKPWPSRRRSTPSSSRPQSLPQPQRSLLVHASDMTSTLARHYGEPIALRVLDRHEGPQWYRRHIVLETSDSRRPVEYGAMRVLLPLLSEAARTDVLAASTPLGAVLARHGLNFRHCPSGYFRVRANRLMAEAFGLSSPAAAVRPLQLHERQRGTRGCGSDRDFAAVKRKEPSQT